MHGRGMQRDLCLDSLRCINLCFILFLCPSLSLLYTLPSDLKANHVLRDQPKELACPPVWNSREGLGNQGDIFLQAKIEKLLRDLELNL
jgi:hypothetical protein